MVKLFCLLSGMHVSGVGAGHSWSSKTYLEQFYNIRPDVGGSGAQEHMFLHPGQTSISSLGEQFGNQFSDQSLENYVFKDHTLAKGSRYRPCIQCQNQKIKTKSGWYVNTFYHCETCSVPLCGGPRSGRNCFKLYHENLYSSG